MGIVPHQIRGYLSTFRNILIRGRSYDCCSACSDRIVTAYTDQGWDFVKRALNEADYVAELSGLAEVCIVFLLLLLPCSLMLFCFLPLRPSNLSI